MKPLRKEKTLKPVKNSGLGSEIFSRIFSKKKILIFFFLKIFENCIFGFDFFCQCWILNVFSTMNECIAEIINICVYIRIFGALLKKSLECYYTSTKWISKAPQAPFIILYIIFKIYTV